ncbi:MAG: thiamine phosphate synthase [Azovibrio sp.]|nr:thiamine phosphate synthase [Azovibrio sp.]
MSAQARCPALAGLYAVTPDMPDTPALLAVVEAALAGGCRWLQYRNKAADARLRRQQAAALARLCAAHGAGLIVNDDVELARTVGAAGVHLGRDDGNLAEARRLLGPQAVLGASCYQDFARAAQAVAEGASYVAFGAVYASPTKPGAARAPLTLFERARRELPVPACAIGGLTLDNVAPVLAAGARLVAVISDVFQAGAPAAIAARVSAYQRLFEDLA